VNLGDTFGGSGGGHKNPVGISMTDRSVGAPGSWMSTQAYEKSLLGIPERFVIMMTDAGWKRRFTVIWSKQVLFHDGLARGSMDEDYTQGSVMPTSSKDRLNVSWEPFHFFTKQAKFYFNLDEIRLKYSPINEWGGPVIKIPKHSKAEVDTYSVQYRERNMQPNRSIAEQAGLPGFPVVQPNSQAFNYRVPDAVKKGEFCPQFKATEQEIQNYKPGRKYSGNEQSAAQNLGKTRDRIRRETGGDNYKSEGKNLPTVWHLNPEPNEFRHYATFPESLVIRPIMVSCPIGGIVLDPFAGTSTVGAVALKLKRKFVGLEISPEYIEISKRRLDPIERQEILI
ncbi:MAG: site-specific DNA-methyltransferase, partial [candidate division Zixibacteria bacterium]|nr:site-specific DNA-methyltransferase [candidate division Zixibacteria bacterium]